jgi:hypothetical protein
MIAFLQNLQGRRKDKLAVPKEGCSSEGAWNSAQNKEKKKKKKKRNSCSMTDGAGEGKSGSQAAAYVFCGEGRSSFL